MTPLAFTDTETTHLDCEVGEVWEVAVVLREQVGGDTEYVWQIRPDLATADPEALRIGRYGQRFAVPDGHEAAFTGYPGDVVPMTRFQAASAITSVLRGAVLLGSNPGFDAGFLRPLLGGAPWHYRPVDVATLAAAYLHGRRMHDLRTVTPPWSSRELSRAVGVEPPGPDAAHTALGDARWMRDLHDAVMQREVASDAR